MKTEELIEFVKQWGEEKGITGSNGKGSILSQLDKLEEEIEELFVAHHENNISEIQDAIGDITVVMILLGDLLKEKYNGHDFNLISCLEKAYKEIKDRTGKMIDGQFVKDK